MNTATIKITAAERKEGVSKKTGNPYTKYIVHAEGGGQYDTFDAGLYTIAFGAVGQQATALYEIGQFGNDLKSLAVIEGESIAVGGEFEAPAPVRDRDANGNADWDLIGLRKTRCALWAALFAGPLLQGLSTPEAVTRGIAIVTAAESDTFHRPPALPEEDIPF